MMQTVDRIITRYVNLCVKLLRKIGYTVPKVYRNKKTPAIFAVVVPLIVAIISITLIGTATLPMFVVHICGVAYHYFVARLENEKYKREYARVKTTAKGSESHVYSNRCAVVASFGAVTLILPLISLLVPDKVSTDTAIWWCAFTDIAMSCVLNIINSLVLWSGADTPISTK